MFPFRPKVLECLRGYNRVILFANVAADVTVGIVALPLAIGFGIRLGVTPAQGLWTAIVAGFLISLLGGSRVQIGVPTGAFVPILAGIVAGYEYGGLAVATLMAGVLFGHRLEEITQTRLVTPDSDPDVGAGSICDKQVPPGVVVYCIEGPFFFGAVEKLETALARYADQPRLVIVRMAMSPLTLPVSTRWKSHWKNSIAKASHCCPAVSCLNR